jgi:hypothetical protein
LKAEPAAVGSLRLEATKLITQREWLMIDAGYSMLDAGDSLLEAMELKAGP